MRTELKKTNQDNQILKKHVAAIHIGAKLSLLQRKLVNALLYNAYDQLLTAQEHHISASVLCEMIGFDSKNIGYLKAALKGLMETVVEFDVFEEDGERSWEAMVLLPYAKIKGGMCSYRYEQALAEKLYHPDVYSKINLSVLRELNSSHALVLYENCYRFEGIGHTAWWDIDIFRKLMAVDMMPSYKPFKALNRNVIQPAMKEVNKLSNIQIEMETRMKGRSVTGLRFLVRPNSQLSLVSMDGEDDITASKSYKALISEGVGKTLARAWVMEHSQDYILEKLELAKEQDAGGKIKSSKVGFLKAAIEQNFHNEKAEKRQKKEELEKQRLKKVQSEKALEKKQELLRKVEKKHRQQSMQVMQLAYENLDEKEQTVVLDAFQKSLTPIQITDFKKNGWASILSYRSAVNFWNDRDLSLPALDDVAHDFGIASVVSYKVQISELQENML